MYILYLFYFK